MKIAIIRHSLERAENALEEFDKTFGELIRSYGGKVLLHYKTRIKYEHPLLGVVEISAHSYSSMLVGMRFDAVYSSHDADPFYLPLPETIKP